MIEPEVIYSTTMEPDIANPLDVLAFLLVPDRAFLTDRDDVGMRAAVYHTLHDAKRWVLLEWYRRRA